MSESSFADSTVLRNAHVESGVSDGVTKTLINHWLRTGRLSELSQARNDSCSRRFWGKPLRRRTFPSKTISKIVVRDSLSISCRRFHARRWSEVREPPDDRLSFRGRCPIEMQHGRPTIEETVHVSRGWLH